MVILELGIMKNGVPLVSCQFFQDYNIKNSAALRAGFLSGLNTFVEHTFSDHIESFVMKNFKIIFQSYRICKTAVTVYCIGDKRLKIQTAKKALNKVAEEFNKKYGHLKTITSDLSQYTDFIHNLNEILGDLIRSTDDRVKSVF
ncbi:MAG: hypothetical protein ACTSRL_04030 [Candidatus Helarchaeota archaeon]